MAVKTPETQEQQDAAYNPGELHSAEQFPNNPTSHTASEEGGDHDSNSEGKSGSNSNGDGTNKNEGASANTNRAKNLESNGSEPGGWKDNFTRSSQTRQPFSAKSLLKKKGPIGLIIALLGGGGLGIGALLSPSLLLVQIKSIITNDLSDSSSAVQIRADDELEEKVGGLKNKLGICGATITFRCKFGTMSDDTVSRFEDNGFEVEGKEVGVGPLKRTIVSSITLPDGKTVVSNPAELKAIINNPESDPALTAALQKVFSPATPFVNKFFSAVLSKLGLTKNSEVSGNDEDEVAKSEDAAIGIDENADPATGGKFKAFQDAYEKGKGIADQAGKSVGIQMACLAYNLSSSITTGVKIAKIAAYTAFAMVFLVAADQIIAGDADPTVISTLGNQLTQTDQNNQSATDSAGYQDAAYGDSIALPASFIIGGGALLLILDKAKNYVNDITGGTANTKALCKAAQGAGDLQCIAGPEALAGCAAMAALGPTVISPILNSILKKVIEEGAKIAVSSGAVGAIVGNGIFVGAAGILGNMAQSFGMMPSSKSQFQTYTSYVEPIQQRNIAVARYEGQTQPLDIYNQYSFLGSIASNLNLAAFSGSSIATNIAKIYSMIPTAFASIGTASAAVTMPNTVYNAQRFSQCDDPALQSIGVDGDVDCLPRFSLTPAELSMNSDDVINYMIDNGDISDSDPTGAPTSSDYSNFIQYCGSGRTDPWGETSQPIESGSISDADWYTGKECTEDNQEMDNFRVFTMDNAVNQIMDGSSDASAAATAYENGTATPAQLATLLSPLTGSIF